MGKEQREQKDMGERGQGAGVKSGERRGGKLVATNKPGISDNSVKFSEFLTIFLQQFCKKIPNYI